MGHIVNGYVAIDEGLGKKTMENGGSGNWNGGGGGGGVSLDAPVFKKRRVSAVRDFPPGCGRYAARINVKSKEDGNDVVGSVENSKGAAEDVLLETSSVKQSESSFEFQVSDVADSSAQTETPSLSKSWKHETARELEDSLPEPVNNSESLVVDTSQLESPIGSVLPDKSVQRELSDHIQSPVAVEAVVKSTQKKFPPRPRVPAVRDFPPGCGRNAAPIDRKDLNKPVQDVPPGIGRNAAPVDMKELKKPVNSSNDRNLAREKSSENNKKEKIAKADVKQVEDKVQAADDSNHKMKEKKEFGKSPADSSISKKVDRGSGSSEGKLGMESVKVSKDVGFKKKSPGMSINESRAIHQSQAKQSGGLDSSDDRVIVLSLMAKPNCPWMQNKKTFKSSPGIRPQVEQGKKTFKSPSGNQAQMVEHVGLESSDDIEIVQSLMAAPNCPWRSGKKGFKSPSGQAKQRSSISGKIL